MYYLEHPNEAETIAKSGLSFLKENYRYSNLYKNLISQITESNLPIKRDHKNAYQQVDMIYYYQNGMTTNFLSLGILDQFDAISWKQFNNLMVIAGTIDEVSIGNFLLLSMATKVIPDLAALSRWQLCCRFYEMGIAIVPKEQQWILKWNFFLLSFERKLVGKNEAEILFKELENERVEVEPFDEKEIFFKYYLNTEEYPQLKKGETNSLFIELNLGLMKCIDDAEERARLYHRFALAFLSTLMNR